MDGIDTPPAQETADSVAAKAMMHMTFFWGKNTEILFSGWPGYNHLGMYLLALIIVFFFGIISEWLGRRRVLRGENHLLKTVVYGIRAGFVYLLMLAIMSFNGGVFLAAVAGHCVGFFLFGRPSGDGEAAEIGKMGDVKRANSVCV